jgi:hypothetical protein
MITALFFIFPIRKHLSLMMMLAPDIDVFFLMPLKAGTSFQ